jgi:hypothetical protein
LSTSALDLPKTRSREDVGVAALRRDQSIHEDEATNRASEMLSDHRKKEPGVAVRANHHGLAVNLVCHGAACDIDDDLPVRRVAVGHGA